LRRLGATALTIVPSKPISSRFSTIPERVSIYFRINTCKSVSKQMTSTPFRINTCEKHKGRGRLLLTKISFSGSVPSVTLWQTESCSIMKSADGPGDRWSRAIGAGGKSGHRRRRLARAGDEVGQRAW
jgi:hypothetical protein